MKKCIAVICLLIYIGYVAAATVLNSNSGEVPATSSATKQAYAQSSQAAVSIHHHVATSHPNQGSILHPLVSSGTLSPLNIGGPAQKCESAQGHFLSQGIPLFLRNCVLRL